MGLDRAVLRGLMNPQLPDLLRLILQSPQKARSILAGFAVAPRLTCGRRLSEIRSSEFHLFSRVAITRPLHAVFWK